MTRRMLIVGFDALDHVAMAEFGWETKDFDYAIMDVEEPSTGPSWTSIFTGDPVSVHKVSAKYFKDWTHGPSNHASIFLWERLSHLGYRSGLFHLPITYPPRVFWGWQVSGFPLPDKVIRGKSWDFLYPQEMKQVIPFRDDHAQTVDPTHWNPAIPVANWIRGFQQGNLGTAPVIVEHIKADIAYHLELLKAIDQHPVFGRTDLLFFQWGFLDRIGHICRNNAKILSEIYPITEELFCTLRKMFPADYVVVLSDHGFKISSGEHRKEGVIGGNRAFMAELDRLLEARSKFPMHNLWVHKLLLSLFPTKREPQASSDDSIVKERLKALGYFD